MTAESINQDDERNDVSLTNFDLFDPEVQQCPHLYYAEMQRVGSVFPAPMPTGDPLHLITRHDDVLDTVRDVQNFSNSFKTSDANRQPGLHEAIAELYEAEGAYPNVPTMLTVDPPVHTRFRRLISKAFTPKVIAELEPTIREITGELIDDLLEEVQRTGAADVVQTFAVPLPVRVIARALNVPDDRLDDFKRWSDAAIIAIGRRISIEERLDAEREIIEFQRYFEARLEERRTAPQDDILTNLLNARIERHEVDDETGEPLDASPLHMGEMLSILKQLLVAGNETTTKMLSEMVRLLAEHPNEFQALRGDLARSKNVVEETLRLSAPTQGMFRNVMADATVGDTALAAGDQCVVMFAAANRDPNIFEDPHTFNPDRPGVSKHLAFGKGTHFCLGAALSRLEGVVAAEELAKRLKTITLANSNDFAYYPSFMLRGLLSLDVIVTEAPQNSTSK